MIDEHSLEGYCDTRNGLVFVQSNVVMSGDHILFDGLSFYPASGAKMILNVGDGARIFHAIMDEARKLGFKSCTLQAVRSGRSKPKHMLSVTRRLR